MRFLIFLNLSGKSLDMNIFIHNVLPNIVGVVAASLTALIVNLVVHI